MSSSLFRNPPVVRNRLSDHREPKSVPTGQRVSDFELHKSKRARKKYREICITTRYDLVIRGSPTTASRIPSWRHTLCFSLQLQTDFAAVRARALDRRRADRRFSRVILPSFRDYVRGFGGLDYGPDSLSIEFG
ncbi:hypothetical protein GWI33_015810 [Rhynchophorus ferrugineus]|uniref:Uncharacterized protein n=1 Tax=Rhynchophorus ferrugineus TaxID=354439 RepID=A0A834I236_RHYFE|nr:hypothetical protein GWI33_015810 [Rhynchophorus ferrugineus]